MSTRTFQLIFWHLSLIWRMPAFVVGTFIVTILCLIDVTFIDGFPGLWKWAFRLPEVLRDQAE